MTKKKTPMNPLAMKVSDSTTKNQFQGYIHPGAAEILMEYPRMEAIFEMIEDEEGIERPAIAITPETSIKNGKTLKPRNGNRLTVHVSSNIFDIGTYIMDESPVFEDEMDWFLFRKQY